MQSVKLKVILLLKDNVVKNLGEHGFGDKFLDRTPKVQSMKEITDMMNFITMKNFCLLKDNGKRMRRQATAWGKLFAKDTSVIGLISKI